MVNAFPRQDAIGTADAAMLSRTSIIAPQNEEAQEARRLERALLFAKTHPNPTTRGVESTKTSTEHGTAAHSSPALIYAN